MSVDPRMSSSSTPARCWYCFDVIEHASPPQLPIDYNAKTGKFKVRGQFCSWPCVKTYNRDMHLPNQSHVYALIRALYASIGNKSSTHIPCLPYRESLIEFGGTMTREEFRALRYAEIDSRDILYVPDYLVDVHGNAPKPIDAGPSTHSGFSFGPMKIPETKLTASTKTTSASRGPKRAKMDVVSMLTTKPS